MAVAGVDVGAKNTKVVLFDDGEVLARGIDNVGFDAQVTLKKIFDDTLEKANLKKEDITRIIATGSGRREVKIADNEITEVSAVAKGAIHLFPHCRTVIDIGAEEGRAMRCDGEGKVIDFVVNEKCAAGAGIFTETMARALELTVEELAAISLESDKAVPMNAQCAVFAESEVISLIHQQTPKKDIAKAIHDAIASRIISMTRKIGFQPDVVLVGGVAYNQGFYASLDKGIDYTVAVPENPEFVGALGAAILAAGSN